jgi:hypothetical protein
VTDGTPTICEHRRRSMLRSCTPSWEGPESPHDNLLTATDAIACSTQGFPQGLNVLKLQGFGGGGVNALRACGLRCVVVRGEHSHAKEEQLHQRFVPFTCIAAMRRAISTAFCALLDC